MYSGVTAESTVGVLKDGADEVSHRATFGSNTVSIHQSLQGTKDAELRTARLLGLTYGRAFEHEATTVRRAREITARHNALRNRSWTGRRGQRSCSRITASAAINVLQFIVASGSALDFASFHWKSLSEPCITTKLSRRGTEGLQHGAQLLLTLGPLFVICGNGKGQEQVSLHTSRGLFSGNTRKYGALRAAEGRVPGFTAFTQLRMQCWHEQYQVRGAIVHNGRVNAWRVNEPELSYAQFASAM